MKRKFVFWLLLFIVVVIFTIFYINNSNKQFWLNDKPIEVQIENRISGDRRIVSQQIAIDEIISSIKKIECINQKPEETWGLGYSVLIYYDNINIEYYFATSTHLFISKNDVPWREYLIEVQDESVYKKIQEMFKEK